MTELDLFDLLDQAQARQRELQAENEKLRGVLAEIGKRLLSWATVSPGTASELSAILGEAK